MLRKRNSLPFLGGLCVWLAIAAILFYTNLASAQQTSTSPSLSAPDLTAQSSDSEVDLSWTAVSGAVRYKLLVWDSVNNWRQIGGDNLAGTSHTHSDVTAGTTYYYTISAVNADGETSAWSEYASVTVSASSASAPALTAEATENAIKLSWTAVTEAVRYELWVWDSVNGLQQIGGDNLTGTSYTHTDVTSGQITTTPSAQSTPMARRAHGRCMSPRPRCKNNRSRNTLPHRRRQPRPATHRA